jgi:hypothetical protein
VIGYLLSRMLLLIAVIAVVSAAEWLVARALGLEKSAWTLLGTAVALAFVLRVWSGWQPRSRRGAAVKRAGGEWWASYTRWASSHVFVTAVADGVTIFIFLSLWSLVFESPSDLTIAAAAACGGIVFAFSEIVGLVERRRAQRQRLA